VTPERILVVDDSTAMIAALLGTLEDSGYEAVGAGDGQEALRRLRAEAFDLVVSDVVLPGLGGLQLLEEVRRLHPELPVLLVTGYATPEVARDALSKGAAGFLEKPFTIEQLLQSVRAALWRAHCAEIRPRPEA
jgi:DNA-binding NtrC family response regulator